MPFELIMKDLPSFTLEDTLDNTPYIIEYNYNSRGEFWTITFYDRDRVLLVAGIKMLLNFELISNYPDRGLPPGELWVMDFTGNLTKPGRDDFVNERLKLIYYTEGEIET